MEYYIIALKKDFIIEYLYEIGKNSEIHLCEAIYAKKFKTFKEAQDLIKNMLPKPLEGYWETLIQYYDYE
jgi:hypothetical protein